MPRIGGILYNSMTNGEGVRTVIFFAGCGHRCRGCHNKHLWDKDSGDEVSVDDILDTISSQIPLIDGVTFSGGEPFEQIEDAVKIANFIKYKFVKKIDLWVYTGYRYEDLKDIANRNLAVKELLCLTDVLVDGRYIEELHDENLRYRGSSNQRIIKLDENGNIINTKEYKGEEK